MSIQKHSCNSITAIKKLAKNLKKSSANSNRTHFHYLNAAARSEGFENFNHALNHFQSEQQAGPWVSVRCRFRWRDATFNDLAGHLQVDVTPLRGLSEHDLQRIVFVIPEFWIADAVAAEREHFRIDSAHFHRVTSDIHAVDSARCCRYVLSFHLLNSRWQASIFDYDTSLSHAEMELEIERALVAHIIETVKLHQEGKLDKSRVLSLEVYEEMTSLSGPAEQKWALFPQSE